MRTARWRSQTIAEIQLNPHGNASSTWPVTILPSEKLRVKSSPSSPAGWRIVEAVLSRRYGDGANQNAKYLSFLERFAGSWGTKKTTTYFEGKTRESVGEWLEKNNLPKFKSVFEIVLKFQNECAYDTYCNGLFLQKKQIISSAKFNNMTT